MAVNLLAEPRQPTGEFEQMQRNRKKWDEYDAKNYDATVLINKIPEGISLKPGMTACVVFCFRVLKEAQ